MQVGSKLYILIENAYSSCVNTYFVQDNSYIYSFKSSLYIYTFKDLN